MSKRLAWILLAASGLLNAVFLAGALFGWTTSGTAPSTGPTALSEVTEELSLTPEQVATLEALRQGFASRREEMRQARGGRRGALVAALAEESFDRPALEAMMAERSVGRRALFADMAESLHGYLQGLSPEQRAHFLERAAERGFLRKLMFGDKRRGGSGG